MDSWYTIQIILTIVLPEDWTTHQVDDDNVFAQAELSETVFVDPTKSLDHSLEKM